MGDSENNIKENTPPIYVLLPICVEANTDVFFNILRNVLARSRLHDNFLDNALTSGMSGEKFSVDSDDLSVNWKMLNSDSRQIRQAKMLGYWATRNYPLMGKKLIGAAWQPPRKNYVEVIGSIVMNEELIDAIIFKKMKLRILQLSVSHSTLAKLKYFVKVPMAIGKMNELQISPKIKAFDVESKYLQDCWQALKLGEFSLTANFEQQIHLRSTLKPPESSIVESHFEIEEHRVNSTDDPDMSDEALINKPDTEADKSTTTSHSNPTLPINVEQIETSEYDSHSKRSLNAMTSPLQHKKISPCNVVLTDLMTQNTAKASGAGEPTMVPVSKRARLDLSSRNVKTAVTNGDSNFDTLQTAVFEMRKDIGNLTKRLDPIVAADDDQVSNGPERLHVLAFKQKDAEISRLKESLQRLRKDNVCLKNDNTNLSGKIERKSELISALQKGMEANSKLNAKSESDLAASLTIIEEMTGNNRKLQGELNAAKKHAAIGESHFQSQIEDLVKKLSESDRMKIEMIDTNGKLQEELNAAKNHAADIEPHFQSQIEDLVKKLSESDRMKIEMIDTNGKLQEELNAAKNHAADIEPHFQSQIEDLVKKLSESDRMKIEMIDTNGKLQEELNAAKNHAADIEPHFQSQIEDLVKKLSESDRMKIEMIDTNGKLQEELNAAKNHAADIEPHFQSQIEDLVKKLSESDRMKIEMIDTNGKLQEELNAAKNHAADIEPHFQSQIEDLVKKLSESDRTKIEMIDANRKLKEELDAAKMRIEKQERLQEELNILRASSNNLISELEFQIENLEKNISKTEKIDAELAGENGKLKEELNILKQNAAINDKELSLSKEMFVVISEENTVVSSGIERLKSSVNTLEEQHKLNIQTESMKSSDIDKSNSYDETKPSNENSQHIGTRIDTSKSDQELLSEPLFETDDPIVKQCRETLLRCQFGWIKFYKNKNKKYPGFLHPPDPDGIVRAQKVTANGYVSNANKIFEFSKDIPDKEKEPSQVLALNKLNKKFGFSHV